MIVILNSLALGSLYVLLSSGLALMYGMRGVMNFAHGALYMLGAYFAYTFAEIGGFWLALVAAPLALAVIGVLSERFALRYLVRRDLLEVALLTLGVALIVQAIVMKVWGAENLSVQAPSALQGSLEIGGATYPRFRIFLIVVSLLVMVLLWLWLSRTRNGLFIRSASTDRETTSMMGVDVDRVSMLVVGVSLALAGLAGVLASAYLSVNPGIGIQILIPALMVIVIGGLGSITGAGIAAYLIGFLEAVGGAWLNPSTAAFFPYLTLIAFLVLRPQGMLGQRTV